MVTIKSGLSPGVRVKEMDVSDYVSNQVSTLALLIGNTTKGPAFKIDIVPDERTFVELYGTPTDETVQTFFAASGFFSRGSNLIFTRVVDRPTARVAALGFAAKDKADFPTVENLDPVSYSNDPELYSEVVTASTIPDQSEIEAYYGKTYNGVEAFYTRHTKNRATPRERNTVYEVGDLVHDGWYENAGVLTERFNGQTTTNKGAWDASSNTAPDVSPDDGDYYIVSVGGTTTFGLDHTWVPGDIIIFDLDYIDDVGTAWGNWRKLVGTLRPNGRVYRCITAGLTDFSFNTSGELAQAIADGIVVTGTVLAWDTEMEATTTDGEVVWQRVVWTDETIVGGILYKHGTTTSPEYYDPEDTTTFDYNVEINGESKSEDLVIAAIGPGEAYNDYYVALIGWRDAENLKKYPYSLSVPRAYLNSNSAVPVEFADWGDASIGVIPRHFLSRVTYKQFVDRFDYLGDLPDNLPKTNTEFGMFILVRDTVSDSWSTAEYWRVSTNKNSFDENGSALFIEDVINNRSKLIRAKLADTAQDSEFTTTLPIALDGGYVGDLDTFYKVIEDPDRANGNPVTLVGELVIAGDMYREQDVEVDIILEGDKPVEAKHELAKLAEDLNGEAFAILDMPYEYSSPIDMVEWVSETLLLNTSFAGLYHNRYKINDKYNGIYRWVAGSGTIGGVYAKIDRDFFPWYAPMGINRAVLTEMIDIREKFRMPQRDILYANRINPVAVINSGITIYGQKTLLDKNSYLSRINVRRLINYMKRRARKEAEQFVGEFNDSITRTNATQIFNNFCQRIKNDRGLEDFLVVCNETNNPPEVREQNEMYIDLYVKPTPVAEFVYLRFYVTRSSINLQELATRVAG